MHVAACFGKLGFEVSSTPLAPQDEDIIGHPGEKARGSHVLPSSVVACRKPKAVAVTLRIGRLSFRWASDNLVRRAILVAGSVATEILVLRHQLNVVRRKSSTRGGVSHKRSPRPEFQGFKS